MLPCLQAEESSGAATATAVGTGSLKPSSARSITRAWDHLARGGRARAKTVATPHALAGARIGVRLVRPKSADASAPGATT